MKKISILFLFIFVMMDMFPSAAATVTTPEAGKVYHLVHNRTGFYLTTNIAGQGASISPASGEMNQRFHIIPQSGGLYQIQEIESGLYWYKRNNWDTGWCTDPLEQGDRALFELPVKDDCIFLECHFKHEYGNFFGTGTDNNSTWVSSDRSDSEVNSQWRIIEYDPSHVEKTALQEKMVEIKSFMRSVDFGTEPRQYSERIKGQIEEKLREAQAFIEGESTTQEQIDTILHELTDLFTTLQATRNPFDFDPENEYFIIHSSGFYLSATESNYASLVVGDGNENQRFKIEIVKKEDDTYYYMIKRSTTGEYWYRRDRWDTGWTLEPDKLTGDVSGEQVAQPERAYFNIYEVNNVQYAKEYVVLETQFRFVEDSGILCMGASNGIEGEWLSSDKSQNEINSFWKIVKYDPNVAIKEELYDIIQKVSEFLDNQNVKPGSKPGEYDVEIYNELKNKLIEAQDIYDNSTSQDEVNTIQKELEEALTLCLSNINIIQPEIGKDYYITFEQDYTIVDKSGSVTLGYKDDTSLFVFKPVKDEVDNHTYYQIQNKQTEKYICSTGTYELQWIENADIAGSNALFSIESAGDINNPVNIILKLKGEDNKYLGNDMSGENWKTISLKEKSDAIQWLIQQVDVSSIALEKELADISIFSRDGKLYLQSLRGMNLISIYSISGALVLSEEYSNSDFSVSLPAGVYIVSIKGDEIKTEKVIVK